MSDVTLILQKIEQGDARATEELLPLVYQELRRLAAAKMSREYAAQTLQPTALVHEAWLRLGGEDQPAWQNRAHFFAAAAEAMRRILIDRTPRRRPVRHGGGMQRVEEAALERIAVDRADEELLEVNEALERFAVEHPKKAELIKLRFFAGFSLREAANAMGIPEGTAKRWWTYSRARLYREVRPESAALPPESD
jgi:RNA polymerase sigma factor (TIGR02999 family)